MSLFTLIFAYFSFIVFVFGACVGSFLNVCIYRIPREESVVAPRSHCPSCGKMIKWYHNVPILSYLLLRGRCRYCGERITPRYFIVEALVGTLFMLVWFEYGFSVLTPVYWMVVSGLVLGTFVDFEHMIIPDRVTIGGIIAGLILSPIIPQLHGKVTWLGGLIESVKGLVAGAGILWGVGILGKMVFKKDAMGFGDVKLLGGLGALLGWGAVLFIIMVSSIMGSLVGIGLIAAKKGEWQSRVPYGPYIAAAALIWILGGHRWWMENVGWLSGTTM